MSSICSITKTHYFCTCKSILLRGLVIIVTFIIHMSSRQRCKQVVYNATGTAVYCRNVVAVLSALQLCKQHDTEQVLVGYNTRPSSRSELTRQP